MAVFFEQPCHISHAAYWRNQAGEHPAYFTEICIDDVKDDKKWKWRPVDTKNLVGRYNMWQR
jgi:hypothetical protein